MLYGFFIVIHVLICILLVIAILMQRAKGGGLAGIAGGAASQAVLGGRGAATLLHKVTIGLAVGFGVVCLLLGILSKGMGTATSVTQEAMQEEYPLEFLNQDFDESALPVGEPGTSEIPVGDAGAETAPVDAEPAGTE